MTVKDLIRSDIEIRIYFDTIYGKHKGYSFWFYYNKSYYREIRKGKYTISIITPQGSFLSEKTHLEHSL